MARLYGSCQCEGATQVSKEHTVAIEADPSDLEDFPVSAVSIERAQMGRRIRLLRQ